MYSKMVFFDKTSAGRIINRVSEDTNMCDDSLQWLIHMVFENVVYCIGYIIGIAYQVPFSLICNLF